MDAFSRYLYTGFEHVIPLGYDHILFITALFFLDSQLKSAVIQCSFFTVAHSITLALVTVGYLNFDVRIIESIIALSIFFVALENLYAVKLNWWRLLLVFVFGLVHGMGFASALKEIGLPKNEFITALLGFNIGVEIAQIAVILLCYFLIAKWIKGKNWYSTKFVKPLSLSISLIALFLAIERFLTN